MLRFKSIRTRLFAILSLAIAGVVALLAVGWRLNVEPALRTAVTKNQWEIAKRAADQINDFIERRIGELQTAVEIARFWEMKSEEQKEALYRLLKLSPAIHEVSLVDRDGQERLRLSRTKVYTEDDFRSLAEDEKFLSAIKGEIYISRVYHGLTSEPFITLSVPVKFTAREVRGVVVAEISLRTLWQSIAHIRVGRSGYGYLVDQEGNLIAHPDYSKVLIGTNLTHLEEVKEFLNSPDRDVTFGEIATGESGKRAISTFALVPRTRWGIIVEEPVESALTEVKQVERFAILLLLLILAGAFGMSYWFSERIARPIRALEEGAKLFSHGSLDHRLEIRTGDEVESLAKEFNTMAAALKESYEGLEAKVAERTEEISALYATLTPIISSESFGEVLKEIVERLKEVTGADAALIRILDKETGSFVCPAQIGFPADYLALSEGLGVSQAYTEAEPIISADIAQDSRLKRKKQLQAGFHSCAFLPLTMGGELRGVIHLASRKIKHFDEEKRDHLLAIARQMGTALENRELFGKTQGNLKRIRLLREIEQAITSTLDLRTIMDVLLEKIDLVLPYAATTVRLFNEESGLMEPVACRNIDEKEWKAERWRGGRGIAGMALGKTAAWKVKNVQADPSVTDPEFFRRHGLVSYLGVPLIVREKTLGVLGFYTREEHEFSDEEVEFLTTLAGQAAIAIHKSQLYEEMIKLAADLSRSNKVKDEFLSVMSHELRTPLNVVMGYAGMIRDRMLGEINADQEKALEKMVGRVREQLAMINGILVATQIEADEIRAHSAEVRLRELLNDLKASYSVPLGKEIDVRWDYPSDLPVVWTDQEKLRQILQHLIDNALKFTEKGWIKISARFLLGAKALEFKVTDTGAGIPEEVLPVIFEKFRQLDSSETRLYGGVGIGLYIVKRFTELLKGRVEVQSEVGKGSTFTVTIPVAIHQQAGKQEAERIMPSA